MAPLPHRRVWSEPMIRSSVEVQLLPGGLGPRCGWPNRARCRCAAAERGSAAFDASEVAAGAEARDGDPAPVRRCRSGRRSPRIGEPGVLEVEVLGEEQRRQADPDGARAGGLHAAGGCRARRCPRRTRCARGWRPYQRATARSRRDAAQEAARRASAGAAGWEELRWSRSAVSWSSGTNPVARIFARSSVECAGRGAMPSLPA